MFHHSLTFVLANLLFFMKYMCRTCKTTCSDIIQHLRKEHDFSESNIKDTLKINPNFYKNSFEKI